jgi:hypothetical protein
MARPGIVGTVMAVALALGAAAPVSAGTIYGNIQEGNRPVPNAPVKLSCGADAKAVNTDPNGKYSLTVRSTGPCTLQVSGASIKVTVYENPTLYNFEIVGQGAQRALRPK